MREKDCKYFMAETDEEVFLGDVIETKVVKEFEDGRKITRQLEFKLTEDTLPLALEMGIIESKEADELIDFSEEKHFCGDCLIDEMLNDIRHIQDKMENWLDGLEEFVEQLKEELKTQVDNADKPDEK